MAGLNDIHDRQARYLDAMTETFRQHLEDIVRNAISRLTGFLHARLVIETDGRIEQLPGNQRTLRNLDRVFMRFLNEAGYTRLINVFVGEFHGQITFLQDTLDYLSAQMKTPLPPLKFNASDLAVFKGFRLNAISSLQASMEAGAGVAMQRTMLSIGGLKFSELVAVLSDKYHASIGKTTAIADSAMSIFYRTATSIAFETIQEEFPKEPLRYRYTGPLDKVTRPFCRMLLARTAREPMTKEEIEALDNGQLPNPWLTGGGWNCRHSHILDVAALEQRKAA